MYIIRVVLVVTGNIIIMWLVGDIIRDDYIVIIGIRKPILITA